MDVGYNAPIQRYNDLGILVRSWEYEVMSILLHGLTNVG